MQFSVISTYKIFKDYRLHLHKIRAILFYFKNLIVLINTKL